MQIPSVDHVELMARNGFDFAWIDCEHGLIDMTQCIELIRTAQAFGITPLVRLRSTADTGMPVWAVSLRRRWKRQTKFELLPPG